MLHVARLIALVLLVSTTSPNIVLAQNPANSRPVFIGSQVPSQAANALLGKSSGKQSSPGAAAAVQATTSVNPLLAPLGEEEMFFAAPAERNATVNAIAKTIKTEAKKRPEVRFLGVVRVGQLETDETHAILKVDGRQIYRRIGDKFGEVEVVDIGKRSVTLQSEGERWTIELFEQPIVNTTVASNRPSSRLNRTSKPQSLVTAQISDLPKLVANESVIPDLPMPAAPEVEPPQLPELDLPPDPPELPGF